MLFKAAVEAIVGAVQVVYRVVGSMLTAEVPAVADIVVPAQDKQPNAKKLVSAALAVKVADT